MVKDFLFEWFEHKKRGQKGSRYISVAEALSAAGTFVEKALKLAQPDIDLLVVEQQLRHLPKRVRKIFGHFWGALLNVLLGILFIIYFYFFKVFS